MKLGSPSAVVLVLLASAALLAPPAPVAAQSGSIEGRVVLPQERPPRRAAARYRSGRRQARPAQRVPAVAFLVGSVSGASDAASGVTLVQRDTAFVPPVVFVAVGGTVQFPNRDPFFHNVFSYSSTRRFDLGRYPQGESKSVTFEEAGIVSVFCEVHEHMRAVVVVTENGHRAEVAEDGTFTITGVPPGEHLIAIWHPDHGVYEEPILVRSGGPTPLEVELGR